MTTEGRRLIQSFLDFCSLSSICNEGKLGLSRIRPREVGILKQNVSRQGPQSSVRGGEGGFASEQDVWMDAVRGEIKG